MRGQLTTKIQEIAKSMIGREIDKTELRLYAYLQYVMMNEQKLDIQKISPEERIVLKKLKDEGFIEGGASGLAIIKRFWDYLSEILFYSYVNYDSADLQDKKQ